MQEKKIKTKDMVIAIFCTLLAILCIVFYFLPAFNIKHSTGPMAEFDVVSYSGWEVTRAAISQTKVAGFNWDGLMYIKDVYGFAVIIAGALMPLGIICCIATAVFAYISWLKGENFKKFCFLFSLVAMIFQTISLMLVWFIAIMTKDGNNYNYFNMNLKGGMSYASFVSLIIVFVIAIVACAYNYFLEDYDDDEYEYEDDDDDDEYEVVVVKRRKKQTDDGEEIVEEVVQTKPAKTSTTKSSTKTTTANKSKSK